MFVSGAAFSVYKNSSGDIIAVAIATAIVFLIGVVWI